MDEGNTVPTKKEKKAAREAKKAAARAQAQYRNEHRADPLPVGVSMVVLDKDFAAVAVLLYKLLMVPRGIYRACHRASAVGNLRRQLGPT